MPASCSAASCRLSCTIWTIEVGREIAPSPCPSGGLGGKCSRRHWTNGYFETEGAPDPPCLHQGGKVCHEHARNMLRPESPYLPPSCLQGCTFGMEGLKKSQLELKARPFRPAASVRGIDVDEHKRLVVCQDHPASYWKVSCLMEAKCNASHLRAVQDFSCPACKKWGMTQAKMPSNVIWQSEMPSLDLAITSSLSPTQSCMSPHHAWENAWQS